MVYVINQSPENIDMKDFSVVIIEFKELLLSLPI